MVHIVGSGKKRVKLITLMNLTILKVTVPNLAFLLSFGFWKGYNNAQFPQVSFEWMQFVFGNASWT